MATARRKKKRNKRIVLIKKANDLIESRYKFDIWETRIFLSVLSQIRKEDTEFHTYRIRYRDVIDVFELKSGNSYGLLREGAKSLMDKKFVVNYEENGVKREKMYHILRTIDTMQEGEEHKAGAVNNEYIDVVIEDVMRPLLLQLQKNFTAYQLDNVKKLGVYPIRVYELLKQYQTIGHRTLRIDEMKVMFEVEEKYKAFSDFNRWVIKPAIREIDKTTDLKVTDIKKIKEGRRVVAMKFTFRPKTEDELRRMRGEDVPQLALDFESTQEADNQIAEVETPMSKEDQLFSKYYRPVIEIYKVTPSIFLQLASKHSEAEIQLAIKLTDRLLHEKGVKRNAAGYFVEALRKGYSDSRATVDAAKQAKAKRADDRKAKVAQAIKEGDELRKRREAAVNRHLAVILERETGLAERAVAELRTDPVNSIFVRKKEETFGRPLTVGDFHEDSLLEKAMEAKIKGYFQDELAEIEAPFEQELALLKLKYKAEMGARVGLLGKQ